jgi:hypothetical protein
MGPLGEGIPHNSNEFDNILRRPEPSFVFQLDHSSSARTAAPDFALPFEQKNLACPNLEFIWKSEISEFGAYKVVPLRPAKNAVLRGLRKPPRPEVASLRYFINACGVSLRTL